MDSASSCIIVSRRTTWEFNVRIIIGVPTLFLESPGIVFAKFPGPGISWKMSLVRESPGIC